MEFRTLTFNDLLSSSIGLASSTTHTHTVSTTAIKADSYHAGVRGESFAIQSFRVSRLFEKAQDPLVVSVRKAWSFAQNYFSRYTQLSLLDDLESFEAVGIEPRYSSEDVHCREITSNMFPHIDEHTAVILDLGGAHSVAMALELMVSKNMCPIVKISSDDMSAIEGHGPQMLGALLHHAREISENHGRVSESSPPVFVLNCHRTDRNEKGHFFSGEDFPSAQELSERGIRRVVYVNEAILLDGKVVSYNSDRCRDDIKPILESWRIAGIALLHSGINPRNTSNIWGYEKPFLSEVSATPAISYAPDKVIEDEGCLAVHFNNCRYLLSGFGDSEFQFYNSHGLRSLMSFEILQRVLEYLRSQGFGEDRISSIIASYHSK